MKKIKILLLAVIVIFATNFSFSQKGSKAQMSQKKQFGIENRIPDLNDQQKEQIKKERTVFMSDILPIKNQLKEKQAHLNTLQTAKNVDMKAVNKTIDEISALRTDIIKRRALFRQKIRSTLTDEQRIYYDTHFANHKSKMHNKMQKRCTSMK